MTGRKNTHQRPANQQAAELRLKAEETLQKQRPTGTPVEPEDPRTLLHELEVHQIEIEMQNEQLRQAQEALEASRQRYFDLYDLAPVGYFTLSEKGIILKANLTAATLLGTDRSSLVNRPLSRRIFSGDADIYYLHRKKLFETGEPQVCEMRMLRVDSVPFWARVEASAAKDSETGAPVCRAVMSDITASKQAENALRELKLAFEQSIDGIAFVDMDGYVRFANEAWAHMHGCTVNEIMGRHLRYFHTQEQMEKEVVPFNEIALAHGSHKGEVGHVRKDGTIFPAWMSSTVVRFEGQQSSGWLGIARDITLQRMNEDALRAKNAELERFTRAVSHDLKSPLVTIMAFLGHLMRDMADGNKDDTAQDLAYINSAAKKMSDLLEELLKLSRAGSVANESVEAPLQEIARQALDVVAGRISARGVQVQLTDKPVMLCCDRVRLVEVFQNLIDNAVKFMGDQGEPRIEIGWESGNGEVRIFVRDNGMGIDPLHKDKLFGMFEKFNPELEGSGLGLSLVKRIVDVHGGRIWVESEGTGQGSCFWFSLPGKKIRIQDSGLKIKK